MQSEFTVPYTTSSKIRSATTTALRAHPNRQCVAQSWMSLSPPYDTSEYIATAQYTAIRQIQVIARYLRYDQMDKPIGFTPIPMVGYCTRPTTATTSKIHPAAEHLHATYFHKRHTHKQNKKTEKKEAKAQKVSVAYQLKNRLSSQIPPTQKRRTRTNIACNDQYTDYVVLPPVAVDTRPPARSETPPRSDSAQPRSNSPTPSSTRSPKARATAVCCPSCPCGHTGASRSLVRTARPNCRIQLPRFRFAESWASPCAMPPVRIEVQHTHTHVGILQYSLA